MNSSPGDFSPAFSRCRQKRSGQPLCLMSPIGQKASVEGEISPSHLAHSPLPPTPCSSPAWLVFLAPTAVFTKTSCLPCYSLASLASAYGGLLFLLDDAPNSGLQPESYSCAVNITAGSSWERWISNRPPWKDTNNSPALKEDLWAHEAPQ